jgi:hypothetical protein
MLCRVVDRLNEWCALDSMRGHYPSRRLKVLNTKEFAEIAATMVTKEPMDA